MGIQFSGLEKKLWVHRHRSAHGDGAKTTNEEYMKLIADLRIFKTLFHRVLLKIIQVNGYYFDYYSPDFPIKFVDDPIGGHVSKSKL